MSASPLALGLGEVDELLRRRYRPSRLRNKTDPLEELVFVLLSAKTEEYNYLRTFRALRARFKTWSEVLAAGEAGVYEAIWRGGLGRKKARQIIALLGALRDRYGVVALPDLSRLDDEEAERFLTALPGIGIKTARCVLMYSLGRAAFPVDAHVWRVLQRLGHAPVSGRAPTVKDQTELQARVPANLRYRLHVNLLRLGRDVCWATRPKCHACPLSTVCPTAASAVSGD